MPGHGSAIAIGSIRIPAIVVGFWASIAAHIGFLTTLALIPPGLSQPSATPPVVEFSQGQPISVRIVSAQEFEELFSDENLDSSISAPESHEPAPPIAQTALAETQPRREPEDQTATDEFVQVLELPEPPGATIDWTALAKSLQFVDWSSFIASSRAVSRAPSAPAEDNHPASATAPPVVTSRPTSEPPRKNTPRGIDRGATVIDLPQPVYPRRSIRLGQEGTAVVEITVRADGTAKRVDLRSTSGHKLLDDAAIAAARQGRFGPALKNGQAIDAIVIVPFEFKLTTQR